MTTNGCMAGPEAEIERLQTELSETQTRCCVALTRAETAEHALEVSKACANIYLRDNEAKEREIKELQAAVKKRDEVLADWAARFRAVEVLMDVLKSLQNLPR